MTAPASFCDVPVNRGRGPWNSYREPCGNKAKGFLRDGTPACGVHLRSERLADEKVVDRRDFNSRQRAVSEKLGIRVWGYELYPTRGSVRVLLSELEGLRPPE